MPFEVGTRDFAIALIPCASLLAATSAYVVRGELRKPRGLLGNKLIASASITLLFGLCLIIGSLIYLARNYV